MRETRTARSSRQWLLNELCLTACAVRRYHQSTGDVIGNGGTQPLPKDVQTGIKASGSTGRREYVGILHVEHVGVDVHFRKALRHFARTLPMRGRAPSVKEACFREHMRIETEPDDLYAARVHFA